MAPLPTMDINPAKQYGGSSPSKHAHATFGMRNGGAAAATTDDSTTNIKLAAILVSTTSQQTSQSVLTERTANKMNMFSFGNGGGVFGQTTDDACHQQLPSIADVMPTHMVLSQPSAEVGYLRQSLIEQQNELVNQQKAVNQLIADKDEMSACIRSLHDRLSDLESQTARSEQENAQFRSFLRVIEDHPQLNEWLISANNDKNGQPGPGGSHLVSPETDDDQASVEYIETLLADESDNDIDSILGGGSSRQGSPNQSSSIKNEPLIDQEFAGSFMTVGSAIATPTATPEPPASLKRKRSKAKRAGTSGRRTNHNLDEIMVSEMTMFPSMAITDTEVVVYFFRSLRRPIVSLRLRARGWGPHKIANVLNEYREVNPPYLRNTASVMSVAALRRGERWYGKNWEKENGKKFAAATEKEATEMIQVGPEDPGMDCDILEFSKNLKKHPEGDAGGDFTKCVKYCVENNISCPISELHEIVAELP